MKSRFPIFSHFPDLVFLDSAASAQKPKVVLDAVREVYEKKYANIHRGLYALSLEATRLFDEAREKISNFFGVEKNEIVFTKNGTEAANLFISSFSEKFLQSGDEVIITVADHHANFVPWLRIGEQRKVILKFVEPNSKGVFSPDNFTKAVSPKTKIVAFPHVSNVTGQIFPVQEIVKMAKKNRAKTFLDICQSAPHFPINLSKLGVDAAFFTGHKMGAPSGTGGLFVKKELLEEIPPFLLGGDMVDTVSQKGFTMLRSPQKFEAGTPAIAEIIGLGITCDFLNGIGLQKIRDHEKELLKYALQLFEKELPNFHILGTKDVEMRSGLISCIHPKIHPHDIAQFLDTKNICVRSGLHCAEPIHQFLNLKNGSVRASFWMYNEKEDVEKLVEGLKEAENLFARE
ncbi:cysteine desulfurase [Candidatus Peregrinibacteria bacterium]|nr:cysteine desulfurase [Candidatus Peregrinibacteria bacterium]